MSDLRPLVAYVVGTRPEIIRSALLLRLLKADRSIDSLVVHTGQHYDHLMSDVFFSTMQVPPVDVNLGVGSGSHGEQTGALIVACERLFEQRPPGSVAVFGDTNSSLAAGLAAVKLGIPLVHVEAGCREWEMSMPEEINRRLLDHCSRSLLAVSPVSAANLRAERVPGIIEEVGDPLFEVFEHFDALPRKPHPLAAAGPFALMTLHRADNVDNVDNLRSILTGLASLEGLRVVFPVHPRTRERITALGRDFPGQKRLEFVDPVDYGDLLALLSEARLVLTDSGGLQKEAFWAGRPCVTFRTNTAWIETVHEGANSLVSHDSELIASAVKAALTRPLPGRPQASRNPYARAGTSARVVQAMVEAIDLRW